MRRGTLLAVALGMFASLGCVNSHRLTAAKPVAPAEPTTTTKSPEPSKDAAELPPDQAAKACLKTAEKLEEGGYDAEAIAHYERARELAPKSVDVSRRLAILYDRCGRDDAAVGEFEKALVRTPNDANLLNDFGYFYSSRGNAAAAERHLNRAVQADPAHPHAWANLAAVYANSDRPAEAVKAFEHVLPPAAARCNVGTLLAARGETDRARAYWQEALKIDPNLAKAQGLLDRVNRPSPDRTASSDRPRP